MGADEHWHEPPSPIREESSAAGVLLPAVAAGLVAAVVAGVVWGLIVKVSEYEVGIVAWGVGLLAGGAVLLGARGRRGAVLQVVAVGCALVGIAIGKYLGYAFVVQELLAEEGISAGLFDAEMRAAFREDLDLVFGLFDLLWVGLAVFTAWRMLQPRGADEPVAA